MNNYWTLHHIVIAFRTVVNPFISSGWKFCTFGVLVFFYLIDVKGSISVQLLGINYVFFHYTCPILYI